MPAPLRDADATTAALLRSVVAHAAKRGYRGFAVRDLIADVGISSQTFYARFGGKQACFVAALERLAAAAEEQASDDVVAALRLAACDPPATRALLLEAHAAGPDAVAQRDRAVAAFAGLAADDELGRALAGAIARIAVEHVVAGRTGELGGLTGPLTGWVRAYQDLGDGLPADDAAEPVRSRRRGRAPGTLIAPGADGSRRLRPGPRSEPRAFVEHSQHDRILDAVATVVAADGLDALTVRSLTAHAQISSRAFYQHFASTDDAFAATLLTGGRAALAAALPATMAQPDWRDGVAAGIRALTDLLAEEPAFAKVAVVDALAWGAPGLQAQQEAIATLAATLAQGYERAPDAASGTVSAAVAAAIWELCALRIRAGRGGALPALAPALTVLALAPVVGAAEARAVAARMPSPTVPSGR